MSGSLRKQNRAKGDVFAALLLVLYILENLEKAVYKTCESFVCRYYRADIF